MLKVEGLSSGYGRVLALHEVDLEVGRGEIVALLGSNGAGKTTLLRAISGVQPIRSGQVIFDGVPITHERPYQRVARGLIQVPEGRQVFAPLSVEDNLLLGAYRRHGANGSDPLERVYAMFPVLKQRRHSPAGDLSGGQQQMLAVGRAMMGSPRLLLLDEPSMGLAPIIVEQIFAV
ncbi:MAG: ABC transporter ATP-binding protein, partial [Hyphomicrobiaceae bacterium]